VKTAWSPSAADRRLLPEGRLAGPMPWMIAIMMFLTVLATAAGLALANGARALNADLAGRVTVQLVQPDAPRRAAETRAVLALLADMPGAVAVRQVSDREIAALLEPWLGPDGLGEDVPVPALIDIELADAGDAAVAALTTRVREVAPSARVDRHARWLGPLAGLVGSLGWLAAALVLLMGIATAAAVVLSARGALNTHRATIDVLHLLGATDIQIARLFQRRIALDALFGGGIGLVAGIVVVLFLGSRLAAVGSDLLGNLAIDWQGWGLIVALPIAGALLATVTARLTVVKALRRIL
jgi:cell division transport system permease protein